MFAKFESGGRKFFCWAEFFLLDGIFQQPLVLTSILPIGYRPHVKQMIRRFTLSAQLVLRWGVNGRSQVAATQFLPRILAASYHTSPLLMGPKNNKKGGKKGGNDDEDGPPAVLPNLKPLQESMTRSIAWLQGEFDKNKFGQINAEYFQSLSVPKYGALGKLGQVTVKGGTNLSIAVFDTSLVSAVADAVKGCGLNLNPVVDGTEVVASVPRPTKETRDAMVKSLSKLSDKVSPSFTSHCGYAMLLKHSRLNLTD